ncbi:hypothetical protein GCM10009613_04300 [Pseudonocardia kongjuensis]|uniref:HTH luxR-type domain-containing protein n=1 Tax=Pseudonocardia kongjuensis TaxID=102227 RepID=A0ABN1XGK6_9PSEU
MTTVRPTTEPFVGRVAELAAVDDAWAAACAGRPALVWVDGPAGAGKSALIARCAARTSGTVVLAADGDEDETALAYGYLDQLATQLPGRTSSLLGTPAGRRADPLAVGAELLAALGTLPAADPVLLLLDDLQWADRQSVGALLFVLRRLRHDRVLVLAGSRPAGPDPADAPDPPDPRWERLLGPGRDVRRLHLDGLSPAEVSDLAAALGRPLGSTGAAERLRAHTGGNPLYTRTLLEELPPEVLAGTSGVLPAPRPFAALVQARLARAGPDTDALVTAASVLGAGCPLGLAAAVAGIGDPAPALDGAVRLGLLRERAGTAPARIVFAHPLVRAAVLGGLSAVRRRELHAAAARLLPGRDAVLHRVAAAAGPDPELGDELAALAADRGTPGARAADLLRAAADLAVHPDTRERRTLAAARMLLDHGEIARAAAAEPVIARCAPGPGRDRLLGEIALLTGRFGRARELLDGLPGCGALALLDVIEGAPERAVRRGGAALSAAPGPAGRRMAGFAVVLGLAAGGRRDAAGALLDGLGAGPRAPVDALVARGVLAADDEDAALRLDAAVERARAGEPVRGLALALAFRAAAHDRLGEPGAVEGLELAVAAARDGGNRLAGTLAHAFAAEALAARGRLVPARAHLAADTGPRWWGADLGTGVGAAAVAAADGDPGAVLAALDPLTRPELAARADGLGLLAPRVLRVEALLATGLRDAAAAELEVLDARLAGRAPTRYTLDAVRLRLLLAAPDRPVPPLPGRPARAPLARGRLEYEAGRRLLGTGARRAGVDLLRAARERFAGLGAVPDRVRCDTVLHDAGLTPPGPAGPSGVLGLTPHERAVVGLVVRGLTNREVAEQLFVTPRTVAYHLSNVYAKLGVTGRRQLRAVTARAGG